MVFADKAGEIVEHPEWEFTGQSASYFVRISEDDLIALPESSRLFTLPGRFPVGWDPERRSFDIVQDMAEVYDENGLVQGVAAFLPPGYLRCVLPAFARTEEAPMLPLWAYTAVGWRDGGFVVPAVQVDKLWYWEPNQFDDRKLVPLVEKRLKENPRNRLLKHLSRCALTYHCFAGKNLFLQRGEAPLPIAPACNCACIGCLSLQSQQGCEASHERINFVPTPEEILELAVPHLETVPDSIVSFGQGCEGDPILYGDTLVQAISGMRRATQKGTINLNTNGSLPETVEKVAKAGLDSIRISMNAVSPERYARYYRPKSYAYEDVVHSLKIASDNGVHVAINLLIFPGITDLRDEYDGLIKLVRECGVHMIQLRNLNIDPDLYLDAVGRPEETGMGIKAFLESLKKDCPELILGYFNRPRNRFSPKSLMGIRCI
ncbi:MAG TPA: radical SAM protein [bacterium]|nr:radical SAM protein [bacterium]